MAARNITFGFDFLLHPAGFDIPFHLLSWNLTDTYGYALLICVLNSALCAASLKVSLAKTDAEQIVLGMSSLMLQPIREAVLHRP